MTGEKTEMDLVVGILERLGVKRDDEDGQNRLTYSIEKHGGSTVLDTSGTDGYFLFYTRLVFDAEGRVTDWGCWE